MDGSALNGRSEETDRLRSGFGLSSMRETVTGFGAGGGVGAAGSAGAAVLLLDPEAAEEVDRAVVFFAAEVATAVFGFVERGDRVAIQSDVRGSEGGGL